MHQMRSAGCICWTSDGCWPSTSSIPSGQFLLRGKIPFAKDTRGLALPSPPPPTDALGSRPAAQMPFPFLFLGLLVLVPAASSLGRSRGQVKSLWSYPPPSQPGKGGEDHSAALGMETPRRSRGSVNIRVPDDPVIALFGRDAILHCSFSPDASFSLAELSLIWQLTDTKRLVHSFASGQDQLADQGSGYVNRTALFYEELPRGNVSLLLRRVQISDEGSFTCFVRVHSYSSAAVTLQVAALYSKPNLNLEPSKNLKPGDLVMVTCHTFHGYPAATVLWQDGQGNNITENVTTSQVANEEGLFDVQSILRVVLEPNSTYSCLVRNPVLQQETHASVTITGQHLSFPAVALWVTVGLAICILGLLGALAYVCRKKIRQSCKEEEENAGMEEQSEDGGEPKTALQPLKSIENKEGNEQEID